ncbi:mCG1049264 [Mus musculus]|nr:mCG1049264 [Mus musculus]
MRHLPQWETEHGEPGSFKDDVCLSLLFHLPKQQQSPTELSPTGQ